MERASELEREERVAAGDLPDPQEHRPRKRDIEASAEELVERANTERTQVELEQPLRRHVAAQRRGELAARGQDGGDRFAFEARQRIAQQR